MNVYSATKRRLAQKVRKVTYPEFIIWFDRNYWL